MDIRYFYCKHCGIKYEHQMSGYPAFDDKSSEDYCNTCNTIIQNALKKVPIKVSKRYVKYIPKNISEKLRNDINTKFTLALYTNSIRTIIECKDYIPIKIDDPDNPGETIILYCSENEDVITEARISVDTGEIIEII